MTPRTDRDRTLWVEKIKAAIYMYWSSLNETTDMYWTKENKGDERGSK